MFYKFKKGKQSDLLKKAILKAGSERKLAVEIKIPKGSLFALKKERRNLSENNLKKILSFLGMKFTDKLGILEKLPADWGRIKGGKNLIKKRINENSMDDMMANLRRSSSIYMKTWHKNMKQNEPEKYHKWQYERFKKIGKGYRFALSDGTKVRNSFEKEVGDFLLKYFTEISYETYFNVNGKAYFPDFSIKNIIVEATEWRHPSKEKIEYLLKKQHDFESFGFVVCFFIPTTHRKFYKTLKNPISSLPELKQFIDASLAQTRS